MEDVEVQHCDCIKATNYSLATMDTMDTITYFAYAVLVTSLVFVGLVGNVVAIFLFSRRRLWSCLNYYLIALALWDSALLLSSFGQFSYGFLLYGEFLDCGSYFEVCFLIFIFVVMNTTLTGCIWILVCLTIERYLAIWNPFWHRTLNNELRAKVSIVAVSVVAIALNIPRAWEMSVQPLSSCTNVYRMMPSALVTDTNDTTGGAKQIAYFVVYRVFVLSIIVYVLPCSILAILTIRMTHAIQQSWRIHRRTTPIADFRRSLSQTLSDCTTNRTLVAVLVKFLVCYSFPTILDVMQLAMDTDSYSGAPWIEYVSILSNVLVVLNSSCNFIIYYFSGRKFRAECLAVMRCCRRTVGSHSSLKPSLTRASDSIVSRRHPSTLLKVSPARTSQRGVAAPKQSMDASARCFDSDEDSEFETVPYEEAEDGVDETTNGDGKLRQNGHCEVHTVVQKFHE